MVAGPLGGFVKCRHCGFASRGNGRETGALNLLEHRKALLANIAAGEVVAGGVESDCRGASKGRLKFGPSVLCRPRKARSPS